MPSGHALRYETSFTRRVAALTRGFVLSMPCNVPSAKEHLDPHTSEVRRVGTFTRWSSPTRLRWKLLTGAQNTSRSEPSQRRVLLLHLDRFVDVVPSPNSAVAVFVYLVGSTELTLDLLNSSKRHWISLSRRKNTAPSPSPQIT
jgi:hypothetical protein